MFSVIEKASGRWVGRLGPWQPEGWPGTEVGWGLARDAWGKGYATEGAAAAIDWAFDALGWDDVIHCIDPGNAALGPGRRAPRLGPSRPGPDSAAVRQTRRSTSGARAGRMARAGLSVSEARFTRRAAPARYRFRVSGP